MRKLSTTLIVIAMTLSACTEASIEPSTSTTIPGVFGSALQTFGSCDELLDYYVTHGVDLVGPYGLGGYYGPFPLMERAAAEDQAAESDGGRSYTGTNVQVAGVDEADIMKTDGDRIFTVVDGALRVARVTDGGIDIVGNISLEWSPQGMLLFENTLLLVGGSWGAPVPMADDVRGIAPSYQSPTVRIVEVDVAISDSPKVVRSLDLDGTYIDSRIVDGIARIAINSDPVGFEWEYPQGSGIRAEREAIEKNREIIRNSNLDNWLPYFVLTEAGGAEREGRLLDCTKVMAPEDFSGLTTLAMLTFDLQTGISQWTDAGVVASGTTMYATAERTYLATQPWNDWSILTEAEAVEARERHRTQIHLFETNVAGDPRYVGSGDVAGFLLNQFSMDEHNGHLRVASTTDPGGWSSDSESRVTVLALDSGRLVEVGQVGGLGETERIYAVRFMGDLGYVVTFRQTDPLYVLDLSDPTRPAVTGELKIPGYSAYLHPVGDGLLLGVGQDADEDGRIKGVQISLFDVSDPSAPKRLDQLTREGGWSQVEGSHHAFTFSNGLALIPFEWWQWIETGGSEGKETFDTGILAVRVLPESLSLEEVLRPVGEGPLSDKDIWRLDPWRMVPLRTTIIEGWIYTITNGGIAVHSADTFERIEFEEF